jgi:hypothetical protein
MPDTFQDDFFADELPPPETAPAKHSLKKRRRPMTQVNANPDAARLPWPRQPRSTRSWPLNCLPAAHGRLDLVLSGLGRLGLGRCLRQQRAGQKGLTAYHQHPLLRTVCVDRTFWRPLTASQYAAFAAQVDTDFRFVVKCPAGITDAQVRSEEGKPREANPRFWTLAWP